MNTGGITYYLFTCTLSVCLLFACFELNKMVVTRFSPMYFVKKADAIYPLFYFTLFLAILTPFIFLKHKKSFSWYFLVLIVVNLFVLIGLLAVSYFTNQNLKQHPQAFTNTIVLAFKESIGYIFFSAIALAAALQVFAKKIKPPKQVFLLLLISLLLWPLSSCKQVDTAPINKEQAIVKMEGVVCFNSKGQFIFSDKEGLNNWQRKMQLQAASSHLENFLNQSIDAHINLRNFDEPLYISIQGYFLETDEEKLPLFVFDEIYLMEKQHFSNLPSVSFSNDTNPRIFSLPLTKHHGNSI